MCTALTYHSLEPYVGRNLDLDYDFGETIITTPRNFPLSYKYQASNTSHYPFLGIGTVVDNYPLYSEAFNDQGLFVAGLNFPYYAHYESSPKPQGLNLAPYEIINWLLANCANLEEVQESFATLNIVDTPFQPQLPNATLHWLIADKQQSMVLESTAKGINLQMNPVRVLTNAPDFPFHLTNLTNYLSLSPEDATNTLAPQINLHSLGKGTGALGLPGDDSSTSRFIRAVFHCAHAPQAKSELAAVVEFFHLLDKVKTTKGAVKTALGYEYTRYSCCISQNQLNYYYKTYENPNFTKISLLEQDLDSQNLNIMPLQKPL